MLWLLILVLVLFAVLGVPGIGIPHTWGYYPSGFLTVIVVILFILLLTHRL